MADRVQYLISKYHTKHKLSSDGVWKGKLYESNEIQFFNRGWCWKTLMLFDEDDFNDYWSSLDPIPQNLKDYVVNKRINFASNNLRQLTPIDITDDQQSSDYDDPLKEKIPISETLNIIDLDLKRLIIDPCLQSPELSNELKLILFNFINKTNFPYKQGYHEICGVIFLQLINDENRSINTLNIFQKFMKTIIPSFYLEENLIKWTNNVFNKILKVTCPYIHQLLVEYHGLDNSIWLIRWTRLIFLREFDISYTLMIWDHLMTMKFYTETLIACIITICLILISQELFSCEDHGDLLSLLLHYPTEKTINCVKLLKHASNLSDLFQNGQFDDMEIIGDTILKIHNPSWFENARHLEFNRLRLQERLRTKVEWKLKNK